MGVLYRDRAQARCRGFPSALRHPGCSPLRSSGRAWRHPARFGSPARRRRPSPPGWSRLLLKGRSAPCRNRTFARSHECPSPVPRRPRRPHRRPLARNLTQAAWTSFPRTRIPGRSWLRRPLGCSWRAPHGDVGPACGTELRPPPPDRLRRSPPRNWLPWAIISPAGSKTMLAPSKTSSSCPPTRLT